MKHKMVIAPWYDGLNELLNGQQKKYDPRTKKMRVFNPVKAKNEKNIIKCLNKQGFSKVKINTPIAIHYKVYAQDKRHDRMNIVSCFDKCFCDAIQTAKLIRNDGYDDIVKVTFDYEIDKANPRVEVTITELQN